MAPGQSGQPQVVIDLCGDEDDAPPLRKLAQDASKRSSSQQTGSKKQSTPIDITSNPDRRTTSKDRSHGIRSSSRASDAESPAKKQKQRSPLNSKNYQPRQQRESDGRALGAPSEFEAPSKSSLTPRPMANGGAQSLRKRPREAEEPSSDSSRPDKRQRSLQLGKEAISGSQEKHTSRPPLPAAKQAGNNDVIDLTSDVEEELVGPPQQPQTGRKHLTLGDGIGSSPKPQAAKSAAPAQLKTSPRRDHGKRSTASSAAQHQSKSSPIRRQSRSPRRGNAEKRAFEVVDEEPRSEIPESLPGTPETAVTPSSTAKRRLQNNASPSKAAPAAVARIATQSSPGPGRSQGPGARPLPLTPSESSADEAGQAKDRSKKPASSRPSPMSALSLQKSSTTEVQAASTTRNKTPPRPEAASKEGIGQKAANVSDTRVKSTSFAPSLAATASTSAQVERATGHCLDEMQRDNENWARNLLQRARSSAQNRQYVAHQPTSVFSQMVPTAATPNDHKKLERNSAKIETEIYKSNKKSTWNVPYTTFSTPDKDVPAYSHFVKLKHNFLVPNETTLQHWPYFDDDTNSDVNLSKQFSDLYSLDIVGREQKLVSMLKAESLAEYAEQMLRAIDCEWSDVLRFLLSATPDVDVGKDAQATKLLQGRDTFCKDVAPYRNTRRWSNVLKKLPLANPEKVAKAGFLCERFNKLTRLSLWHVARRSDYTRALLDESHEAHEHHSQDQLTCRVCLRFCCPYHGEIENPDDDGDDEDRSQSAQSDGSLGDIDVVATDIINPPTVNYRSRVGLPPTIADSSGSGKDRRSLNYWQSGAMLGFVVKPDERAPFFPCHHPGLSCSGAHCSCHTNKISCEKTCACSADCVRKFQGCNCQRKGKICFNNEHCACFNLGRECDPDLCGTCGVCNVLDPQHRGDDRVLLDRCRNVSIQRGIPKHTMIGESETHGFGLYACEPIREHDFIGEYKGEVITKKEAERRGAIYEHQKLSYLFSLNNSQEVDSTFFGNKMRFINHATKDRQNVYARIITVNTVHRIGLYANRDVKAGKELCFDYGPLFTFADGEKSGKKDSKAVPHVRNANITKTFWDPEKEEDRRGDGGFAAQKSQGRPSQARFSKVQRTLSGSSDFEMAEAGPEEEDDEDDDFMDEIEDE